MKFKKTPELTKVCPVCQTIPVKEKNDSRFLFCPKCHSIINSRYSAEKYDDSYFIEGYKAQYGKTYVDDFSSIYTVSKRRLNEIAKLATQGLDKKSVLDLGCATGFFLKAAEDAGATSLEGVEISQYASDYAKRTYAYTIDRCSFDEFQSDKKFDLVTAWFFVEHNFNPVVTILKMGRLLKNGGVIAFSVPSPFGPAYHFNKKQWYLDHPTDHSLDLSPKAIVLILKKNGFHSITIKPASYHPERVINPQSLLFPLFKFLYIVIAKLLKYGDTIEVYAKKDH